MARQQTHWKVIASFYVPIEQAFTAEDAERLVASEVNNDYIQKYIGDTIGDVDVHEGNSLPWDMEG